MQHARAGMGFLAAVLLLAGCENPSVSSKPDPLAKNVIDDAGLSNLLLNAGDPAQAVRYFQGALAEEPERADFRRGLAVSLNRAGRPNEAARVYQELDSLGQATPADLLEYGFISVRLDRWDDVRAIEARIPEGLSSPRRELLSAMLSDNQGNWAAADLAYERAEKLSANPASILNNWGVSRMSRQELVAAERLFERALSYDSTLFNAKNNLAIARALQGNYQLPVVPMTDQERATILNNLGVIAVRNNDIRAAKGLFAAAVDAHPQHYPGAASRLASLEQTIQN